MSSQPKVISWLNGKPAAFIAAEDRGLAFGDGLFETLLINSSTPTLLHYHLERLAEGAGVLQFPLDINAIENELLSFIRVNGITHGVLKLILSRGAGPRGYAPSGQPRLSRLMLFYRQSKSVPFSSRQAIKVDVSRLKLARQPDLAGIKHLNRLEQVLAKTKKFSQCSCEDSILLDTLGNVIETVSSNIFVFIGGELLTPDLSFSGVNGTVRRLMLAELEADLGITVAVRKIKLSKLRQANVVFSANSVRGVSRIQGIGLWSYPSHALAQDKLKHQQAAEELQKVEQQFLRIAQWVDSKLGIK